MTQVKDKCLKITLIIRFDCDLAIYEFLLISLFAFEGGNEVLILPVPGHCLIFAFHF